jgi:type VII secretion-associated serine protease mycosin
MGITGNTGTDDLTTGARRDRSRLTRCPATQRVFGVLAALGLVALGTAAPAAASGTTAPASTDTPVAVDGGQCKFGGDVIKSTPWSLQRILLDELWDQATGEGVKVAVIDTGVDKGNPQLKDALAPDGKDFVGKTDGTTDTVGHGTEVAGIIAARKGDGTGFVGLAPDAKILPLRYTGGENSDEKGNSLTLVHAIDYAVDHGADIINISSDTKDKKPNTALGVAVENAIEHGVIVVAAAGNDGQNGKLEKTYPASYPGVVAVAASDRNNERAEFSQSGHFVDIAAPGVGMVSTVPNGGQCVVDGTSFSAPYVSGVLALMKEKYGDAWSNQEIIARLEQTADRPGADKDPQLGWGVVDPVAALTGSAKPQEKPHPDKQESSHVTPMELTIGESATEHTQRMSVYVVAISTVLTLLVAGTAIAARDHRRKREATATAGTQSTANSSTTTSTGN